jgi:signal transduction histidine kinase
MESRATCAGDTLTGAKVATALEANKYLSVPIVSREKTIGRVYVIGGPCRFDKSAMGFVTQLIDHLCPVIENIRVVDTLTSDAAEQERRRIARDIHDSVIQPYLGLQFTLTALAHKLEAGNTDVLFDVKHLLELTNDEVRGLRRYVSGLQTGDEPCDALLPAIHRYAERFSSVTGINVKVKAEDKVAVNARVGAELFQIVTEGLNNVRRHAVSEDAFVEIACVDGKVLLQIKNRCLRPGNSLNLGNIQNERGHSSFTPHSISERAAFLGGETTVAVDENNYTVVSVGIPL